MIKIGRYNTLKIAAVAEEGLLLSHEEGEQILMPKAYCSEDFELEDELKIFVFVNKAGDKIATNLHPKIFLYEFGYLKVKEVNNSGAFLDWGMPKDLMVPFSEQKRKMELGERYIVYFDIEEDKQRLYASSQIDEWLQNNHLTVEVGQEVKLLVIDESDLGYATIVNHEHKGMIYKNEVFKPLAIGDSFKGYVKKITEENKIDLSFYPIGFKKTNNINSEVIYKALIKNEGFLALNDKSSPKDIADKFGISKKAFKKAIGDLYKQRKITLEVDGIKLVQ